jgi:flagellum-specific peptidoglycan hydrolase FlgJ
MKTILIALSMLMWSCAESQTPSKSTVYQEILDLDIKFPDIVLAQAVLESGNFASKVAKQNNNLFGMRMPKVRETTAVGQRHGYARYYSWKDSVKDYKLWQDQLLKRYPNMTRGQYKTYINRIYSTGKNYISKINLIIQKNKNKYEEDSIYASTLRANDSMRISL